MVGGRLDRMALEVFSNLGGFYGTMIGRYSPIIGKHYRRVTIKHFLDADKLCRTVWSPPDPTSGGHFS